MCRIFLFVIFLIFCFVQVSSSQTQSRMFGKTIERFPYPYQHITFIQPRFDRQNLIGGDYINSYVIKAVRTFNTYYHLKIELPIENANKADKDVYGLSDIKLRLLHASPLHNQLYIGYGAEFTLPTATDRLLGGGKWQGRPELGIIYFFGNPDDVSGTFSLGADYRFDIAGQSNRDHISVMGIAPNIDYWAKRWYIGYYATWTYDFNNNIWDIPVDVEFGFNCISHLTLAIEYIQPLLKKRVYNNEFAIKLRYSFQ